MEERLEMGSKRKEEQMRQVREKAAAANEHARVRASMIQACRSNQSRSPSPQHVLSYEGSNI